MGLTIAEAIVYLILILGSIALKSLILAAIVITSVLCSIRYADNKNIYGYILVAYRYYHPAQIFLREGREPKQK